MPTPLEKWVEEQVQLTKPAQIYWCDGSEEEAHRIAEIGMEKEKVDGQPLDPGGSQGDSDGMGSGMGQY